MILEDKRTVENQKLTEDLLEGSVLWLFWRKELKLRNYRPLFYTIDIEMVNGIPVSESFYYFERAADSKVIMIRLSKSNGYYFVVSKPGKVYRSKHCWTLGQFDRSFCKYYRRVRSIMPPGAGLLPGSDEWLKKQCAKYAK